MLTEIKLFLLTKYLFAMFQTEKEVVENLEKILCESTYWINWMNRYMQLIESKETQIILLRKLGYSYRDIQRTLNVGPNTIQNCIEKFDLAYTPLNGVEKIVPYLTELEKRLDKEGLKLW